ncbi:Crp/Fnr family transcriptional regulator [Tenacibaculum amylolyticum]|uniref:Crp/Fnr family transcriptional regulator n=1 Tax=Tenacibaculum amylolyticum TaxID=104269 RepID=UPI0038931086
MSKCEQCIIRELNALKALTKEELVRISNCKTSKTIQKGEILFNEGEHINGVFCIKSGVCKVSKMSENGREQIINLMKRGDLLGERSLISNEVANLKATAVNKMQVCFIPKNEIVRDLQQNHEFSMSFLRNMALTLKANNNTIVEMAQKTVKQRLAHALLYLSEEFGTDEDGALNLHLTREDIANIIGTATETTIRLLSGFKKKGLIQLKNKAIFVLDKNELKYISDGVLKS